MVSDSVKRKMRVAESPQGRGRIARMMLEQRWTSGAVAARSAESIVLCVGPALVAFERKRPLQHGEQLVRKTRFAEDDGLRGGGMQLRPGGSPSCTRRPVSTVKAVAATAQDIGALVHVHPVPARLLGRHEAGRAKPRLQRIERLAGTTASPKSSTLTSPLWRTKTFAGLRSRWMIPPSWSAATAVRSDSMIGNARASGMAPPAETRVTSRLAPSRSSITRYGVPLGVTPSSYTSTAPG